MHGLQIVVASLTVEWASVTAAPGSAVVVHGLRCPMGNMWNLPGSAIELVSPALEGRLYSLCHQGSLIKRF